MKYFSRLSMLKISKSYSEEISLSQNESSQRDKQRENALLKKYQDGIFFWEKCGREF